jgi:hypothetical protein
VQQQGPADSEALLVRPDTQLFDLAHGVVVTADGAEDDSACPLTRRPSTSSAAASDASASSANRDDATTRNGLDVH